MYISNHLHHLHLKNKHRDSAVADGKYALRHCRVSYSLFAGRRAVSFMPWRTTPISSIPILPLSSWCAAGQIIPDSQLLGGKRRSRRRSKRSRRNGSGECSLRKCWLRVMTAPCPSLSAPAVHVEYNNHKTLVVNFPC